MDKRYQKRIERYWTKMEHKATEIFSNIDVDEWFDYWHTHLDWEGKGNVRPENRGRALTLTYQFLKLAEGLTQHRNNEVQCFAIVKPNTGDNAVYLHSANPNGTPFPHPYLDVQWGVTNAAFIDVIDFTTHEVGVFGNTSEHTYFVRKRVV